MTVRIEVLDSSSDFSVQSKLRTTGLLADGSQIWISIVRQNFLQSSRRSSLIYLPPCDPSNNVSTSLPLLTLFLLHWPLCFSSKTLHIYPLQGLSRFPFSAVHFLQMFTLSTCLTPSSSSGLWSMQWNKCCNWVNFASLAEMSTNTDLLEYVKISK